MNSDSAMAADNRAASWGALRTIVRAVGALRKVGTALGGTTMPTTWELRIRRLESDLHLCRGAYNIDPSLFMLSGACDRRDECW
jgi:hypothetical protein